MTLDLLAVALFLASALVLVAVIQLFLIGSRLRAMHQEMIDTHETLKAKRL